MRTAARGWRVVGLLSALSFICTGATAHPNASAFAPDSLNQTAAPQAPIAQGRRHFAQIDPPGAKDRTVEFGGDFELRNGETTQVGNEGLTLRFERVTRDGRCPIGDPCTSDVGDATVLVTVQQPPHEPAALKLHTHPGLSGEGRYRGYRVRLARLEPRPVGEQPVPLPQYRATFIVSR
jgi:hypothetical protein